MVFLDRSEIDELRVANTPKDNEIALKREGYAALFIVLELSDADDMENVHEIFERGEDFFDGGDDGMETAGDVTEKGDES
jgi:hypothetical protein